MSHRPCRELCAYAAGCILALGAASSSARANDRLPPRWQEGYGLAITEVRNYARYIAARVWREKLGQLRTQRLPRAHRARVVEGLVDEMAHLLLPAARRMTRDALFGTESSHLRLVRPDLRAKALRSAVDAYKARAQGAGNLHEVLSQATQSAEQSLDDRLEQALTEDLEDHAQELVETAVGLPVQGRSRGRARPLPAKWEPRYAKEPRTEVHRFTYWWLRKRNRLPLTHLAQTKTTEEIDRARNEGPIWGMTSAVSQEAWAQNRLRIDFKWGRHNWKIDRRRIRRRMDQDLAQATWAMARMAKELTSQGTVDQLKQKLDETLKKRLSESDLKDDAEQYPQSRPKLQKALSKLEGELDPLMDEATSRVPFPNDMTPELRKLAQEHGRRFMHEELRGTKQRALARAATPHVARKQLRDRMGELVAGALRSFDPGRATSDPKAAARAHARQQVKPMALGEIEHALRRTGQTDLDLTSPEAGSTPAAERIYEELKVDDAIDREVERQTEPAQ